MADQCSIPSTPSLSATNLPTPSFWKSTRFKAFVALITLYLIWGTTMGAMHFGIQSIPPGIFAFGRYLIVSILLISFCKLRGEAWPTKAEVKRHAISGISLFAAGNAAAIWAVRYIPTVLGAALMATTPFWMIGLAAMQPPREGLKKQVIAGLMLGFFGILTILAPQLLNEFNGTSHFTWMQWLSVFGMLSTTVFWALGSLYAKKRPTKNSVLMEVGFQNLSASVVMFPFCVPELLKMDLHVTQTSFAALMYLVVIGTIVAIPCYYYVLKHLPVSIASTFAYVSPVITMFVGYWLLGESLSPTMSLGAVLILLGVILVQSFQSRRIPAQPTPIRPSPLQQEAA